MNFMLKGKINHCDTIHKSVASSIHSATVQVRLLEWITGADSIDFTSKWQPKIESVTN